MHRLEHLLAARTPRASSHWLLPAPVRCCLTWWPRKRLRRTSTATTTLESAFRKLRLVSIPPLWTHPPLRSTPPAAVARSPHKGIGHPRRCCIHRYRPRNKALLAGSKSAERCLFVRTTRQGQSDPLGRAGDDALVAVDETRHGGIVARPTAMRSDEVTTFGSSSRVMNCSHRRVCHSRRSGRLYNDRS